VLINGAPEVVQFASHTDEHLTEDPFVARLRPATLKSFSKGPREAQAPLADGLVADHDATSGGDQSDFTQDQPEAMIQPDA
jgi:hypothetical protein